MSNIMVYSWEMVIKKHPTVPSGTFRFKTLADMECHVTKHNIQRDHIVKVVHHSYSKTVTYEVSETIPPRTTLRLTLKR